MREDHRRFTTTSTVRRDERLLIDFIDARFDEITDVDTFMLS